MKITATKREDLMKARDEYDAEIKKMNEQQDSNTARYEAAENEAERGIEKRLSDIIGSTTLDLDIRVTQGWSNRGGWEVRVTANDKDHFDTKRALHWSWEAKLNQDGEVVKDSSSWSGLRAVTEEQIADLEESVRVIKILNGIDWDEILHSDTVKFGDYYDSDLAKKISEKKAGRPAFEDDILTSYLEELVDTNTAIKLDSDQYYRGAVGMLITGMSDKFVKGYIFPWTFTENDQFYNAMDGNNKAEKIINYLGGEVRRASKDKIILHDGMPDTADLS